MFKHYQSCNFDNFGIWKFTILETLANSAILNLTVFDKGTVTKKIFSLDSFLDLRLLYIRVVRALYFFEDFIRISSTGDTKVCTSFFEWCK